MAEPSDCMDGILNAQLKSDPKELQSSPANDAWYESVVPPTHPPKQRTNIPDLSLRLEYIYGFTSEGMRGCVRYSKSNDAIFVASTIGVRMNRGSRAQTFFQRHTDKITAFASTRDGAYAATGQL